MSKWKRYKPKPIWGLNTGTWFDVCLLNEGEEIYMYVSRRQSRTVFLTTSKNGVDFSEGIPIISPPNEALKHYNRACVLKDADGFYRLYVTMQYNPPELIGATSCIMMGKSKDGLKWDEPLKKVLVPQLPWEKQAVMCPHVIWDEAEQKYKMWYSAGNQYEPDAIGYAESKDGVDWRKSEINPIFSGNADYPWEAFKVTACQVIKEAKGYRIFYTGFSDIDTASIGTAFSENGITDWKRDKDNPIIKPSPDVWDISACYKPYVIPYKNGYRLYYNGRANEKECICLAEYNCEN